MTKPPSFEENLSVLEDIVTRLESGSLSLEDSLQAFEQGVQTVRQCQTTLTSAQQKVQILLSRDQEIRLEDFQGQDPE